MSAASVEPKLPELLDIEHLGQAIWAQGNAIH